MDAILKNKLYICLGGCFLIFIALFMPFVEIMGKTISYIKTDAGVIVLIVDIATAVLVFLKKEKLSLVGAGIMLLMTFIAMAHAVSSNEDDLPFSFGAAVWLVILGVILTAGPIVLDMLVKKGVIAAPNQNNGQNNG